MRAFLLFSCLLTELTAFGQANRELSSVAYSQTVAATAPSDEQSGWLPGEVSVRSGRQRWGMVRVDVANNRLWLKQAKGNLLQLPLDQIDQLTLNPLANDQTTVYFRRFPGAPFADTSLNNALMRVVHTGPYGTLVEYPVQPHYWSSLSGSDNQRAVNEPSDEARLHVIRPDQTPTKARLTRRALADALGETGQPLRVHDRGSDALLRSTNDVAAALYILSQFAQ